jgi:hypothetical protein
MTCAQQTQMEVLIVVSLFKQQGSSPFEQWHVIEYSSG